MHMHVHTLAIGALNIHCYSEQTFFYGMPQWHRTLHNGLS